MANIREGRNIRGRGDVQNVITSVILRQKNMFSKEDVFESVNAKLKFSSFGKYGRKRKEINLNEMVEETLNTMWINDFIKYFDEEKKYKLSMGWPALVKG